MIAQLMLPLLHIIGYPLYQMQTFKPNADNCKTSYTVQEKQPYQAVQLVCKIAALSAG